MKDKSENNALIRNCTFKFECDMEWDLLEESHEGAFDKVRFCGRCSKSVFFSENDDELRENMKLNRCVAVDRPRNQLRTLDVLAAEIVSRDDHKQRITLGAPLVLGAENEWGVEKYQKGRLWKNVWAAGLFVAVVALLVRVIF